MATSGRDLEFSRGMSPERPKNRGDLGEEAGDKVNPSTSHKKVKHMSKKLIQRPRDVRVSIGESFDNWRELKKTHGLNTDPEVAEFLLNAMKELNYTVGCPEATALKTKSKMQKVIRQEIKRAITKKETMLQDLMENVQQLNEVDLESSIQNLEARINTISKRAEAALAHIRQTQKQGSLPHLINFDVISHEEQIRGNLEDDAMEAMETTCTNTASTSDKNTTYCAATSGKLSKIVESTENTLKRIRKDKEALIAVLADPEHPPPILSPEVSEKKPTPTMAALNREQSPPVLLPNGCSEWREHKPIKQEPADFHNTQDEKFEQFEPKVKRFKRESLSPEPDSACSNHKDEQNWLYYPPLPTQSFPSALSIEAASYSVPKKLELKLAFIKNPTLLSVMWDVKEKDPSDPPMESYTILLTMEKVKGSGIFPEWYTYDKLEAKALPMCALIKKYKPGHKVCAAVVGKDVFGRYGPYSDVFTAIIPD